MDQASTITSQPLADIIQHYLAALRQGGITLLEEARIIHDARIIARHGEWLPFLQAIDLSPDSAERLLHIHRLASTNPDFARAVRTNWLSPSTAALLARASTPPDLIDDILTADTPPTRAEVQHQIRTAKAANDIDPPPAPRSLEPWNPAPPSNSRP